MENEDMIRQGRKCFVLFFYAQKCVWRENGRRAYVWDTDRIVVGSAYEYSGRV